MFTGIVQAVGRIAATQAAADGLKLTLDAATLDLSDLAVGDSLAVNGCCLTIVAIDKATLAFDVSAETLRCTARLDRSRSRLRPSSRALSRARARSRSTASA